MNNIETMKLALDALEASHFLIHGSETKGGLAFCMDGYYSGCFDIDSNDKQTNKAITAIKEALAQPEQEPVQTIPSFTQLQQIIMNLEHCLSRDSKQEFLRVWIRDWTEHKLSQNTTPPQRTWVGLMRGVRVEGDTVVISIKGGNDAARELCGALIEEMNR